MKIIKNLPIPPHIRPGKNKSKLRLAIESLEIGGCVILPWSEGIPNRVRTMAVNCGGPDHKYVTRTFIHEGVKSFGIWRTA